MPIACPYIDTLDSFPFEIVNPILNNNDNRIFVSKIFLATNSNDIILKSTPENPIEQGTSISLCSKVSSIVFEAIKNIINLINVSEPSRSSITLKEYKLKALLNI